jgi:hypothetical protein
MQNLKFPLIFNFKTTLVTPKFSVHDAAGRSVAFVKQRAFKLREDIRVFTDESEQELVYTIKADRWLDWNASYVFGDARGRERGRVARRGARSIWKAHYDLIDEQGNHDLSIQEADAWVKVLDGLFGEIPILGLLTGYFFNPSYHITRPDGTLVAVFTKQPELLGRTFTLEQKAPFEDGEAARMLLGTMMMVLLERDRG